MRGKCFAQKHLNDPAEAQTQDHSTQSPVHLPWTPKWLTWLLWVFSNWLQQCGTPLRDICLTLQTSKEARYMPCYHRSYLLLFQGIWSAYFKKVLFKSTAQCMPWWLWFGKFQILINYLYVKKVVLDINNCCWNDSFLFREIRKIRWPLSF